MHRPAADQRQRGLLRRQVVNRAVQQVSAEPHHIRECAGHPDDRTPRPWQRRPDLMPGCSVAVSVSYAPVSAPQRAIRPAGSMSGTVELMSVQPARHPDPAEPYEVIHLGGETAAIVPLAELRRLRAVERHASREALEEAEIESTLAAHDEWVAAGCPGARSHEDVMAELLGSDQ